MELPTPLVYPNPTFEVTLQSRYHDNELLQDVARAHFYPCYEPTMNWHSLSHDVYQGVIEFAKEQRRRRGIR